jgi:gamma-glutamyltranspeptidase/glutathione hydrolase/leukotriene-C4 hydrolase
MLASPAWAEVYAPHGYLAVEGEWIKRTKYGRTLEIIAKEGVDAFYEGELAQKMVRTIHATGGVLQLDDVSCDECSYECVCDEDGAVAGS